MRIFVASGIFHPESGGPATYLLRFLPELLARGHEVTVLTFGDDPNNGMYPYPVTRVPRVSYVLRQWNYYRAAAQLWPGHDLAYIHSLGLPLPGHTRPRIAKIVGDPAWERAMNKGWIPPDTDIDLFQTSRFGPAVEINKALRAREARQLEHIIVPSEYLKRMVVHWGADPDRVSVITNALEAEVYTLSEGQAEAREKLGLPAGPVLLTPARLTSWKGVDHTIQTIASMGDIALVVAGDGPARPALVALAEKLGVAGRVIFLGSVARDKMPLYYRAADYTLLYSGYEGLSHVLLESLGMGTPVIASDKGGNPEIIRNGVNGLLVPYIDQAALSSAIQQAFTPGNRERLAAGCAESLNRFRWDDMVKRTVEVLESFG